MIAVNRQERDVLRRELNLDMSGIGDLSIIAEDGGTPEELFEARRRLSVAMHLLDDLGWHREDRETFYVTLPAASFRRWLQDVLAAIAVSMSAHAECFAVAGHVGRSLYDLTDEQAAQKLRQSRGQADDDLDRRSVCFALLDRLDAALVA